jgi:3-deoxy-7-phosphoheptulonate synthase
MNRLIKTFTVFVSIFHISKSWTPSSWKYKTPSPQIPLYFDSDAYQHSRSYLKNAAPLVFAEEVRSLKNELAKACVGQSFVYIGGDCAETFQDSNVDKIWKDFRLLLEVSLLLTFGLEKPIVKIGRMAGQFAKPRSSFLETRDGITLPAYQGDIINDEKFDIQNRSPNPLRMISAYQYSCQTLNILRAFIQGGYSGLWNSDAWVLNQNINSPLHTTYEYMYSQIRKTLSFLKNVGLYGNPKLDQIKLFTGHEALLLPYEEPLVREDSLTNEYYACSSHFLWIGERTRQIDGPHVEFLRGVKNPIGIKISEKITPTELLNLTETLNPENEYGRISLITRMGSKNLKTYLPPLIEIMKKYNQNVVWICDPMHGNTFTMNDIKTRQFDSIWEEVRVFCDVHWKMNSVVGGIHLESTGKNVTKVMGGNIEPINDIGVFYDTVMDPRLNYTQTIELCLLLIMYYTLNCPKS